MNRQGATEVRVGVSTEGVERDVPKVEQSGEADHHVESDRQEAEDADLLEDGLLPEGVDVLRRLHGDEECPGVERESGVSTDLDMVHLPAALDDGARLHPVLQGRANADKESAERPAVRRPVMEEVV